MKYQRPTPSGCKDIGIRKFEWVAKTQFLYKNDKIYKKTWFHGKKRHDYLDTECFDHSGSQEHLLVVKCVNNSKEYRDIMQILGKELGQ